MNNLLTIRNYKKGDENQIIDLLNKNFNNQQHLQLYRNLEWWKWKYEDNVFGKPIINVLETNEKIVGVRPFWPWKLSINEKNLNCYQPVDSVIDEKFRRQGAFTQLTNKNLKENKEDIDLIFNFSNEQSINANLKMGWDFVGKLQWYVKLHKPYKAYNLIKNSENFFSLPLRAEDAISIEKINRIEMDSTVKNNFKTIESYDFLNWRYLKHPQMNYGMDFIEYNNKQLTYIYEINENVYGREMIILDYFGDMELTSHMIVEFNYLAKKYDVAFTSFLKKEGVSQKAIVKNLYIKQKRKNFVVLPLNPKIEQSSKRYENWEMTLGMHDSI